VNQAGNPEGPARVEISVDRDSEIPIGVQLAWALRARISDGTLGAGQRLPGLRELAEATEVNINTVRTVYQRLDQEGLINSQQGSGTFVTAEPLRRSEISMLAANAAQDAHELGVDPRDVAATLYVTPANPTTRAGAAAQRRRVLRTQISALEMALGEIEAEHPALVQPITETKASTSVGPRLLDADGLAHVRQQQLRRLATLQQAIEEQAKATSQPATTPHEDAVDAANGKSKRTSRARATPRAARASG
jgi:GntR family transcriptional regulator